MKWFGKKKPASEVPQEAAEFMDPLHPRSSIVDGEKLVIQPAKVLDNLESTMERMDLDDSVPVSISDFVSEDELMCLFQQWHWGTGMCAELLTIAMKIMLGRYPEDLVRSQPREDYDLRVLLPQVAMDDHEHEIALSIFRKTLSSSAPLTDADLRPYFDGLDWTSQLQIFIALFYMYGTRVSAMQFALHRHGD